jgi:hypothetical protein
MRGTGRCSERCVIRGLDPHIHQSRQMHFSKRMDCRAKSGNDDCKKIPAANGREVGVEVLLI